MTAPCRVTSTCRSAASGLVVLALAACGGSAPAIGPAPALGNAPPCSSNIPPPGYAGPVSPFTAPCPPAPFTAPPPAGVWDYSQGQPPRAVRGQP